VAYQLRSANSDLQDCFKKCGKDADKIDKVESCQLSCVDNQLATGRTRSNVGPNGKLANGLITCGYCAVASNTSHTTSLVS
jgi:hypothetical protein